MNLLFHHAVQCSLIISVLCSFEVLTASVSGGLQLHPLTCWMMLVGGNETSTSTIEGWSLKVCLLLPKES